MDVLMNLSNKVNPSDHNARFCEKAIMLAFLRNLLSSLRKRYMLEALSEQSFRYYYFLEDSCLQGEKLLIELYLRFQIIALLSML